MFDYLPSMFTAPKISSSKMPVKSLPSSNSSAADSPPKSASTVDTTPNLSPQSVFSARSFGSVPEFTKFVLKTLDNWRESANFDIPFVREYTFVDVSRDWAEAIFNADQSYMRKIWDSSSQTLRIKMPCPAHNCVHLWVATCKEEWVHDGVITRAESRALDVSVGTRIPMSHSPYSQSQKEPDVAIHPSHLVLQPPNVFEAGWSESADGLAADCELLLRGSGGSIRIVVTIKWTLNRQSRKVSGILQAWRLNTDDQPYCVQTEVIFPIPDPPRPQHLEFTYADIFSSAVPLPYNPRDLLYLDIDILREKATFAFHVMSLSPA